MKITINSVDLREGSSYINLYMSTVKVLQASVVIQRTLCLSWTVKWEVAVIYFF